MLLRLLALSAGAVVAGGTITIWRGYPPQSLSPAAFVEMQQTAIRGLNVFLPAAGLLVILSTLAVAALARGAARRWLIVAALLFAAAGVITRFGNQPINAVVMDWSAAAPPEGWEALRDRWRTLHLMRTLISGVGYLALAFGCLLAPEATARVR